MRPELRDLSDRDFDQLVREVAAEQTRRRALKMYTFKPGDHVAWSKSGYVYHGTVERYLQKNLSIRANDGRMWRCAPTLVRAMPDCLTCRTRAELRAAN